MTKKILLQFLTTGNKVAEVFLLALMILISIGSKSQNFNRGGPAIGKVYGIIQDSADNKAIEYATITLLKASDSSIVSGTITDGRGNFRMEEIPFGEYRLAVSFIGYKTFMTPSFKVTFQNFEVDKGKIKISSSAKKLDEFVLTAEKNDFQNTLDKRVYNVGKNLTNTGGTATDLLQNIPSVTVDISGTVSFRGNANVQVLIDGKPSGLTGGDRQALLDQLPGSTIEQIEIVTNPSAKYDAEGMAGIINIITKKDKLKGINGNVQVSGATHDSYSGSIGLNNRTQKYNIYGNYSYRHEVRLITGHGTQTNTLADTSYIYNTSNVSDHAGITHSGKIGVDFFLSNYTTLGFYGTASKRNQDEPGINFYDYTTLDGSNIFGYTKNDFNIDNNKTFEGGFDYRRSFPNSKQELSATGNISSNIRNENTNYQSSVYESMLGANPYQHNYTTADFISSVVQADYSHPFNPKSKLETGVKGSYRLNDNDQKTNSYDSLDMAYVNDTNFTNHYVFNEQIYAAYFLYSGTLKFFDYHVGLRGEQTFTTINQKTSNSVYHNNYLSFFPNAAIKYSLGYQEDIQFSYSRRINRPNIRSLNPFKDISDSMNIRTGNPFLRPEYINSFELGYTKSTNKTSISATVYYKHSDDLISYYRIFNTVTGKSLNTFENYSSSENIGAEGSVRYDLGKAGNLLWSFNAYNNKVNANNLQTDLQSSSINWNTRLVANLKFAKYTAMQITANYSAPNTSPQSTVKGFSSVDAGVKQDFWKGKASLNVACGDVFNIREFDITSKTIVDGKTIYLYNGVRKRESRILTVSFSYRFGTTNNQTKKKRSDQQGGENMEEPMGY